MPPKATRGRGGRGRGARGGAAAGTTRGGAAAAAAAAVATETGSEAAAAVVEAPAEVVKTETKPEPELSQVAPAAPMNLIEISPTPTPAPAAEAPASRTATPQVIAAAAPSSSSTRASATPAAAATATATKFKPKGVRRNEAERLRIAEEQQRILDAKNAEEARKARANRRGGGRGRGRGGFLMRGTSRLSTAAGPLSSGISAGVPGGQYAAASSGGHGSASSSPFTGSRGSGGGGGGGSGSGGGGGGRSAYGAADSDDKRINADLLYSFVDYSDEEDQAPVGSTRRKKKPLMPMGIRRIEHKEEGVTMTSTAEIEAQNQGGDEEEGESDEVEEQKAVAKDEGQADLKIKEERGDDDEMMDIDQIPAGVALKQPDSPELKKKDIISIRGDSERSSLKPERRKAAVRDPEEEIISQDLERMVGMFSLQDNDAGARAESALEGHMFLFQFPPVLPKLKAVSGPAKKNPVKSEPTDDLVMLDQAAETKSTANIDLTEAADSNEDGEEEDEDSMAALLKDGGFVGNLVVRKSGKVELSWGGKTLDLVPGIQANFLSTAAIVEEADVKPQSTGQAPPQQVAGTAFGMGKIQGSFTIAPVWGDEEEWDVDPEDLAIPEE